MDRLTSHEIMVMFLGLGLLLGFARILGEVARRINLPSVVGEILAGICLGPTVFGVLSPELSRLLFPAQGGNVLVLDGLTTLAISLFLLVAGMEVDLSTIWKQGKTAISVGITGILFPFVLGFALVWHAPSLLHFEPGGDRFILALFTATALSITALPIIVRILMDLNLYRSDLGMIIVAAAALGDLIGWIVFAVILGLMGASNQGMGIVTTILLTLGFALVMLTGGRLLIHRSLPWIQAHTQWPGGILGYALSLGLLGAAFTEWIGVHAIFGSFLVGIAIGDSHHLREQTRTVIDQFVSFIFAPLFFASIGLKVNFTAQFDPLLIVMLLFISCVGKMTGCSLGARWGGLSWRESCAVGAGMISQGSMGIILGLLALQNKVITEPLFVAIVVVSLGTSMMSGPMMQRILRRKKTSALVDHLTARTFILRLNAATREEAIEELVQALCTSSGLNAEEVRQAVLERERVMPTGLGNGVAIPHARLDGLPTPLVCLGFSGNGIDFDAPDGKPARVIVLILSSLEDECAQLEIFADIAKTFGRAGMCEKALKVGNLTEFLALLKAEKG